MVYNTGLFIACAGATVAAQTALAATVMEVGGIPNPFPSDVDQNNLAPANLGGLSLDVAFADAAFIAPIFGAWSVWRRLHPLQ